MAKEEILVHYNNNFLVTKLMKTIITSLGMIVFVAAIVAGGTGAFFSDTETSTGNVFTAGAIDLTVDSKQTYNGNVCMLVDHDDDEESEMVYQWVGNSSYPTGACSGTWEAANLGAQKFFNFLDVKPGDNGHNSISLHIDNNDAYACVDINVTANDDVSTVDPETDAGDQVENPADLYDGELAQNLNFFAWGDADGDNVWDIGESPLFSFPHYGPASDVLTSKTYTLADATTAPLPGGSTSWVGLSWCAGGMTVNVATATLTCNGLAMGNVAQTDSMVANIAFRVEQSRNNANFRCTPREVTPVQPV